MKSFLSKLADLPASRWFWITFMVAGLQRVAFWLAYPVTPLSDTNSYRRSAEAILAGWGPYDGTRTPGYPAFMAVLGPNENLYIAQLLMGFAITLLFFYIAYSLSRAGWFAALVALAHSFSLQQLFFEANLMTETLTTFWLALAWGGIAFLLLDQGEERRDAWKLVGAAFLTGLASALALITRPLFIFLPFWLAFFLFVFWRRVSIRTRLWVALLALLPGLLMTGWWVNFIHSHFGQWSLSAMGGYHMVQHTGAWFEYLPDNEAAIRDTFIKYRDAAIAEKGTPANAIWEAIPELQQVTGDSFYGLSRRMQALSVRLILEHPTLFARSAVEGWIWFWKAPVYWKSENVASPAAVQGVRALILLQRGLLVFANGLFLLGSLAAVVWRAARQRMGMNLFVWFSLGAVWAASVLQTLLDHGDNPRFLAPLQSLVVLLVLWWVLSWFRSRRVTQP